MLTCRRHDFLLAEDETYLNAGTFSALPRAVFDALVQWQRSAEANPTRDAAGRKGAPLWRAQGAIADYLSARPQDLVLHLNITQALNQALLGYAWPSDGELLYSNHEYPAIIRALREVGRRRGLSVRCFDLPPQPRSASELVDAVLRAVTPATRGILLSHVSCVTGLVLPVGAINAALRQRDIRLIVDGAHAPGLLPLSLTELDVDFYGGNLHKWFMGPKGTAFLHVRPQLQPQLEPLVVGFGGTWQDGEQFHEPMDPACGRFVHAFSLQGLRDVSPFLALTVTLDYRHALGEAAISTYANGLLTLLRQRLVDDLGLPCLSPMASLHAGLLTVTPPAGWRHGQAREELYQRHKLTVPIYQRPDGQWLMRVSPYIWNDAEDIERLVSALSG